MALRIRPHLLGLALKAFLILVPGDLPAFIA